MSNFRIWVSQYGYETDVLDKYRDAVRRSNRVSLKVLGAVGICLAILVIVYNITAKKPPTGITLGTILIAAGAVNLWAASRENISRRTLIICGYSLSAAYYIVAIYASLLFGSDAFWIGTQMAVCCYLLDYAWRIGLLQLGSYAVLSVVWVANDMPLTTERTVFGLVFLAVGMVTFYTMNRTRVSMIMSREVTKKQADTDLLTGLMNRTAAEEIITTALKDGDQIDVMLLLDLDHFKSVNDRMGHQMGDKVLVDVANDLHNMFRATDVLCRLGGDEFIIFMHQVPEKDWAVQRAEQVVRTVRRWVTDGSMNIQVTASVGVVLTDGMEREYGALYRAADIAMYFAKESGGNRAVMYSRELLNQARSTADHAAEHHSGTSEDLR